MTAIQNFSSERRAYQVHNDFLKNPAPVISSNDLKQLQHENIEKKNRCVNYNITFAREFKGGTRNMIQYMSEHPFFSPRIWGPVGDMQTVVGLNDGLVYPANYIHFHRASYIQAESPQKSLPGTQKLYYQMAIESGANLLVAATSGCTLDEDPDKYMHFLLPGETIEINENTKISCIREEVRGIDFSPDSPLVTLRTLVVSQENMPDREIYQMIPNFEPVGHLCPQQQPFAGYAGHEAPSPICFEKITEKSPSIFDQSQKFINLLDTIALEYKIQIDEMHPLLVNCIEGKNQSGIFIVLYTLYKDFFFQGRFNHQILKSDLLTQIKGRAFHVSCQSVQGAASEGFDNFFKQLSQQFPEGINKKEMFHQAIQSEYIKSILSLPQISDPEKERIKLALESDLPFETFSESSPKIENPCPKIENESIKQILKSSPKDSSKKETLESLKSERDYWKARAEELERQLSKRESKEEDRNK